MHTYVWSENGRDLNVRRKYYIAPSLTLSLDIHHTPDICTLTNDKQVVNGIIFNLTINSTPNHTLWRQYITVFVKKGRDEHVVV